VASKAAQRVLFENVASKLRAFTKASCYAITRKDVIRHGGTSLLKTYGYTVSNIVKSLYPSYDWIEWKFGSVPDYYWNSDNNQRAFFDDLAERLTLYCLDDWYTVTHRRMRELGATGILYNRFNDSVSCALEHIYPEHEWKLWRFSRKPNRFLEDDYIKSMIDKVAHRLNVKAPRDWEKFSIKELKQSGLLELVDSPHLESVLPPRLYKLIKNPKNIVPVRRESPTREWGYWFSKSNIANFVRYAEQKLNITSCQEWYRVSAFTLLSIGGGGIAHSFGSVLRWYYPTFPWLGKIVGGRMKKSKQWQLRKYTHSLFV